MSFGGAPLAHLEAWRLWRDITLHNFAACFACCSLIAPSALPKIMEQTRQMTYFLSLLMNIT